MVIDCNGGISIEESLLHYRNRYGDHQNLPHIVRALGYLDDVADDPGLPAAGSSSPPVADAGEGGRVWVNAYQRGGTLVGGYWRRR